MTAYFNEKFIEEKNIALSIENRAFLYGDGFFETILCCEGEAKLLAHHLERINGGLMALQIENPEVLKFAACENLVRDLFKRNKLSGFAKLKIIAWRTSGGTYQPTNNSCDYLFKISPTAKPEAKLRSGVSFSQKVQNLWSPISKFKSASAQNYVLAALEMQSRHLEDIIITDTDGNVSECLVSNIFWVKGNKVFTPSLETGCIEGASRKAILNALKESEIAFEEVRAKKERLLSADHVFCTNAMGLTHIIAIDGKNFEPWKAVENIYQPY